MIILKSDDEVRRMRRAGAILAAVLKRLALMIRPGVTTKALDEEADRMIREAGGVATFRGQPGLVEKARPYPAATCISINEQVIHGIPSNRVVRDGDLVSVDCGVTWQGMIADAAITVIAGKCGNPELERLVRVTKKALIAGIKAARAGNHLQDISAAVFATVSKEGFGVVREFCGHGVGRELHEDPPVPNVGSPGCGPVLRPGMTLAIEPMVTLGNPQVRVLDDGWTVVTQDSKPAAHFEHTVLITKDGPEVLTLAAGESLE